MHEDEPIRPGKSHELGMKLDELSIGELEETIEQLKAEITRLEDAIASKSRSLSDADAIFRK